MTTKNKKSSTNRWLCSVPVTIVARLGTDPGRVKRRVRGPRGLEIVLIELQRLRNAGTGAPWSQSTR